MEIKWMEKPYLNVVTNNTLADVYSKNDTPLGMKFETDLDKIKQACPLNY